jgi:hypothetical protein
VRYLLDGAVVRGKTEKIKKSLLNLIRAIKTYAGVAELGKGAGLRTLSRRSPRVRITPPA